MIKLICPECESDQISYFNNDASIDDTFKCSDCNKKFPFVESQWITE